MKKLFATLSAVSLLTAQMGVLPLQMSYATSVPPAPTSTSEASISYDTSAFVYVDNSPEDGDKMYLNTAQPLNIRVVFPKPTQHTTVVLKVPKRLEVETPAMSTQGGASILTEDVKNTDTGTGPDDHKLYTFTIKDGVQGDFNISTKVKFNWKLGYEGQQETLQTTIANGSETVSEDLVLKSYVNTRISPFHYDHPTTFYGGPEATKFADNVPTTFVVRYTQNGKRKGEDWTYTEGDKISKAQSYFYDIEQRIKLPLKATYIGGSYDYDATTHEIFKKIREGSIAGYETKIQLVFSGMAVGEQIQRPAKALTIKAKEGGKIPKTFTYDLPWKDGVISEVETVLVEKSHIIKGWYAGQSLVKGYPNQEIIASVIENKGTQDVKNVAIKYDFPVGMKVHTIYFPGKGIIKTDGKFSVEYTTDNGVSRTVILDQYGTYYERKELGLAEHEFITSATIKIDTFKIGDTVRNVSSYIHNGLRFIGDVDANIDENLPIHITTTADGSELGQRDYNMTYATIPTTDLAVLTTTQPKKIINPGEVVRLSARLSAEYNQYYYDNGTELEDPTMFLFVPEGFGLIENSLEVENINNTPQVEFVKNITKDGKNFAVYTIKTQKHFYKNNRYNPEGNNNADINVSFALQSDITAMEGDYDFSSIIAAASEREDYKIGKVNGTKTFADTWDLIGSSQKTFFIPDQSNIESIHINKSSFAIQDGIQSKEDKAPVQTFDTASDNYSRYYSADTGAVGVGLYNPKDVAISDFHYDITLPSVGDQKSSEWTATLVAPVDVSAVPDAVASYSSDGTSYTNTFSADARYVRVTIPQIPAHTKYAFSLPLQAPAIDPQDKYYDKTAWLTSLYTFDNTTYDIGVKKLKLMTHREPYSVEHYQEKLDGSYDLLVADALSGVVGETVTADYETYVGYISNTTHTGTLTQGTVNASGSLVLKLYYALNEYSVSFDGSTVPAQTIKYRGTVTQPTTPTKTGYTFEGWYVDSDFATVFDFSTPITSDTTLYAKWTQDVFVGSGSYTVTGSFVRDDCDESFGGSAVVFSHKVTATATGSTLEEAHTLAEQKAKTKAEAYLASEEGQKKAQDYANAHGTCTQNVFTGKYTATSSQVFTPVCEDGFEPTPEAYTSTVTKTATGSTQTEANALAQELAEKAVSDDIINNGQNYINIYGTCTEKIVIVPPIPVLPHTGAEW